MTHMPDYMKHKYTRTYFLKEDPNGNQTIFGAEGVEDFKRGGIRKQDLDILRRINFCGKTVLDLGFGRGEAIKYALENGALRLVGVDFSEDANVIGREFLERYGLMADLYCMDALSFFNWYALQKESQKFDVVLMLDFVEHVPRHELTCLLTLMRNWLSDRAVLAINTPVFQVDNDVIAKGLDPRIRDTTDECEETAGMHCNHFTKESLHNYMRACGFTGISGHFFLPNFSISHFLIKKPWVWWIAFNRGYPILLSAMWQSEIFEYAMSSDEIGRIQNSKTEELRWIIKYRHDLLLSYTFDISKEMILAIPRRILRYYRRSD
jgi:SAM-dependent methyltransferase